MPPGSPDPILLLQMQRMGDLLLTFPLMLWLQKRHPGAPLWVVGEPMFYDSLLNLSPPVYYLPWDRIGSLEKREYQAIINLSHRPEAARLAGRLRSPKKVGAVAGADGPIYVRGFWQLYRSSLVLNNRHNQFHWADLNALDSIPRSAIAKTTWPEPIASSNDRVGLFLGASQEEKRPSAEFWARLSEELSDRGLAPVLLGGPAEQLLGREVARLCKTSVANLCARFDLTGLARAVGELSLLVTPDTGPMHLAAWMAVPCLNLSMGPVNPWETGPYQPGHHVARAAMSCVGCWQCTNPHPFRCRELFSASGIAFVAHRIATGKGISLGRAPLQGIRLLRTQRNEIGLYGLAPLSGGGKSPRELLGRFWSRFFAMLSGSLGRPPVLRAWSDLADQAPELIDPLLQNTALLAAALARCLRSTRLPPADLNDAFWLGFPPVFRPLSGYLQLFLQNEDYSRSAFARALACIEELSSLKA